MPSITEITGKTFANYLPVAEESVFSDGVVLGANTELELVTGWLENRIQRRIADYLIGAGQEPLDFEEIIELIANEIEQFLRESQEMIERLGTEDNKAIVSAGMSLAAPDPQQDVINQAEYRKVLLIRDDALVDLLADKTELREYAKSLLFEGYKKANSEVEAHEKSKEAKGNGEVTLDTAELNLELMQLIGQEAAKAAMK